MRCMYWELALSCVRFMNQLSWGHFKIEPIELNPEVPVNLVFIRKNRYIYYTHPHSFLCGKRKRESNIPTHTHTQTNLESTLFLSLTRRQTQSHPAHASVCTHVFKIYVVQVVLYHFIFLIIHYITLQIESTKKR